MSTTGWVEYTVKIQIALGGETPEEKMKEIAEHGVNLNRHINDFPYIDGIGMIEVTPIFTIGDKIETNQGTGTIVGYKNERLIVDLDEGGTVLKAVVS